MQDDDQVCSKERKEPKIVKTVLYADLAEIKNIHLSSSIVSSEDKVVYSQLLFKEQLPPQDPMEPTINDSSNLEQDGTEVDESEFDNGSVKGGILHNSDNYQDMSNVRGMNKM